MTHILVYSVLAALLAALLALAEARRAALDPWAAETEADEPQETVWANSEARRLWCFGAALSALVRLVLDLAAATFLVLLVALIARDLTSVPSPLSNLSERLLSNGLSVVLGFVTGILVCFAGSRHLKNRALWLLPPKTPVGAPRWLHSVEVLAFVVMMNVAVLGFAAFDDSAPVSIALLLWLFMAVSMEVGDVAGQVVAAWVGYADYVLMARRTACLAITGGTLAIFTQWRWDAISQIAGFDSLMASIGVLIPMTAGVVLTAGLARLALSPRRYTPAEA